MVETLSGRGRREEENKNWNEGNTVQKREREKSEKWTKKWELENKESGRTWWNKRMREARK